MSWAASHLGSRDGSDSEEGGKEEEREEGREGGKQEGRTGKEIFLQGPLCSVDKDPRFTL